MIFKNLYFNIVIRILLISGTCLILPFVIKTYHDYIISLNVIALIVLQIVLLIRKLNFVNRDLVTFLDSIKYDDSSVLLNNKFKNQDYFRFSERLQNVSEYNIQLKKQNIEQDQYFKTVTEHASIGLLSFDEIGNVNLCNKAFKNLLNLKIITNISSLNKLDSRFEETLRSIKPSEQKLFKINLNNKVVELIIQATDFKTDTQKLRLISMQDIKTQLDKKELESWQKMVQILRHEIMNSLTPISSTIDTLNGLIVNPQTNKEYTVSELNNEIITDIASGLKIIKERNVGIQEFIQKFRNISKLPTPKITQIDIRALLEDIQIFWRNDLKKKGITFNSIIDDNIQFIYFDKNQLEQVLINLIKNAIEAINGNTKGIISLHVSKDIANKTEIKITDNGVGIPPEIMDEVFIPFFTTKKEGSGIGLSLARQLIRLHGGNILIKSIPDRETTFTLIF